ncbi:hypothetical protein GCM10009765_41420 [Fodinicola feengrottensis]|uniref:Uncharacterized protein n=1 Tax=Fodinicola feengrottensis TaxID=435914 RepID=A0ABN2HGN7_9ACTN
MQVRRPLRLVAVAVLAVLALSAAAGCQNRFGAAAFVGDDRFAAHDVDAMVSQVLNDPIYHGQLEGHKDIVQAQLMTALIQTDLFEKLAAQLHTGVGDKDLAAARTQPENVGQAQQYDLPLDVFVRYTLLYDAIGRKIDPQLYRDGVALQDTQSLQTLHQDLATRMASVLRANEVVVNPAYGAFDGVHLVVQAPDDAVPTMEPWIHPLTNLPSSQNR